MLRPAARARLVLLALVCALGACGKKSEKKRDAASEDTPSPLADVPLCNAVREEAKAMASLSALQGDVFVLRFATEFKDHADVTSAAKGATKTELFVIFEGWVDGANSGARLIVDGSDDLAKVAPYVVRGSLDGMGAGDIALPARLASAIGADLGTTVQVHRPSPTPWGSSKAKTRSLRVVALLDFPGHAVTGMNERFAVATLAGARSLGADDTAATEVTGVRMWYAEQNPDDAAASLRGALPAEKFRVMTQKELQSSTSVLFSDARAACAKGLPAAASSIPEAKRDKLCSLRDHVTASGRQVRALAGDYYIIGDDLAAITTAVAKTSPGDSTTRIASDATLATEAAIVGAGLVGMDPIRMGTLAERVVRGDLAAVDRGEGIAIEDDLATALRVDVGSRILVRLRPLGASVATPSSGLDGVLQKLRERGSSTTLEVAAVLSFPSSKVTSFHESVAWASTSLLRKLDGPTEYVVVWEPERSSDPLADPPALDPFLVSFTNEMADAKLTPMRAYDDFTVSEFGRFANEVCAAPPVP